MVPKIKMTFWSAFFILGPFLLLGFNFPKTVAFNLESHLLSELQTESSSWKNIESLEEQPVAYLGGSPRDLAFSRSLPKRPQIPLRLKTFGENEFFRLLKQLSLSKAEFEAWITYNGWGNLTWAISRYRSNSKSPWQWLNSSFENRTTESTSTEDNTIILPKFMDPKSDSTWDEIFNNTPKDLYHRPYFGNLLWLDTSGIQALHAWLPPSEMERWHLTLKNSKLKPVVIPPPSRLGEKPVSFIIEVSSNSVTWPEEFNWVKETILVPQPKKLKPLINTWPVDFRHRYLDYLKKFSDGIPIHSPLTGHRINTGKLGVGEQDNQLLDVVAYLKEHYKALGFGKNSRTEVTEQPFVWRGIPQANLIAKIKGSLPADINRPIILSDHIDKAIAEDIYEKTGKRITTPGADDNGTATAAVLMAAELFLKRYENSHPLHDIYFVHFTGEEFPGSSLGARYFVSDLLSRRIDVGANIDMDMMGHHTPGDNVFQINPGGTAASWTLAEVALFAAHTHAADWVVKVPQPWSKSSYITQTDATFFDYAGYPTILINEHMNLSRKLNPYYHQSNDTYDKVDLVYAVSQTKVAIETAAQMAEN